ncbi:hypothetical protein HID58_038348 [Brassica napus]|uniref:Uncharacterized protein n=1 Tax=Brassica napus TaxID=3708 RepID=A0ABQ8BNU4_BRANA|nr:hypothetical protein HID58_038348 [Brassica napus]
MERTQVGSTIKPHDISLSFEGIRLSTMSHVKKLFLGIPDHRCPSLELSPIATIHSVESASLERLIEVRNVWIHSCLSERAGLMFQTPSCLKLSVIGSQVAFH